MTAALMGSLLIVYFLLNEPKLYYKPLVSFCYSCDCYLMKDILQNWSDEDAALILDNLFKAMKPDSRLLLIEAVLHTGSHSEERVGTSLIPRPKGDEALGLGTSINLWIYL